MKKSSFSSRDNSKTAQGRENLIGYSERDRDPLSLWEKLFFRYFHSFTLKNHFENWKIGKIMILAKNITSQTLKPFSYLIRVPI